MAIEDIVLVVSFENGAIRISEQHRIDAERLQTPLAEGKTERDDFDGQLTTRSQALHQFFFANEYDDLLRRRGHNSLAYHGPAMALDHVEERIDLVGPVDGDIQWPVAFLHRLAKRIQWYVQL